MIQDLEKILKEQREEYQRYLGVVAENFESQVKVVAESVSGIHEQMKIMREDVEIIKQNLRRKVDVDDFEALEKRVLILEKKRA